MEASKPANSGLAKRAILYLRVSTARQASQGGEAEGYSIPAQRDACRRKAAAIEAEVVEEFVDAGASARSADRPALQALLERLKTGSVDYVIVHKVDRLARDRADDVAIGLAIHTAGATLVSASEAIDATPAGVLLHGIMAAISEFYSNNLSQEAKKGLHEKARRGGTPSYAPLGYVNARQRINGREVKTIEIDDERAEHIKWAFKMYATGQVSVAELTHELEERGLKSRTTAKFVGSPLTRSMVHRLLSNPYYIGKLRYGGVIYDGNHEPLIDEITFQRVQVVLSSRRLAGDRSWKHLQYLKGSVYCKRCGERLGFGYSKGRGGEYAYFFCLGRHLKRTTCRLPYMAAAAVEACVIDMWDGVTFHSAILEDLREDVDAEFATVDQRRAKTLATQQRRIITLERQKQKLIDAYLTEAISLDDLKPRQEQVQAELANARDLINQASAQYQMLRSHLETALELAAHAGPFYRRLPSEGRKLINQAFFAQIRIDVGKDGKPFVTDVVARPEFKLLSALAAALDPASRRFTVVPTEAQEAASPTYLRRSTPRAALAGRGPGKTKNPGRLVATRGSNLTQLAEEVGFEPTVGCPTHDFQSCRFGRSRTPPGR
jgi:site-specific DNA recombinase